MLRNPESIAEKAKEIVLDLLPRKSRDTYHKEYENFNSWKENMGVAIINEDVVLNYFHEKVSSI